MELTNPQSRDNKTVFKNTPPFFPKVSGPGRAGHYRNPRPKSPKPDRFAGPEGPAPGTKEDAEKVETHASGVETPEENEPLTAGLKPRPPTEIDFSRIL